MKHILILTLTLGALSLLTFGSHADEKTKEKSPSTIKSVVLAGGCFWCVESDFDKLKGVKSTTSGYAGGSFDNPTYDTYHNSGKGVTPHIEVVKIEYDSSVLKFEDLIYYHFKHIDPTDGGGQFCDRGESYRPAIFVANEKEEKLAEGVKKKVAGLLKKEIAVEILPASKFWPAEDYHQDFHNKNSTKYGFYRWNCGRDQKVKQLWSDIK